TSTTPPSRASRWIPEPAISRWWEGGTTVEPTSMPAGCSSASRPCSRRRAGNTWTALRGQLLIASPGLLDPNFHRAVVLVVEHGEEGAVGLVLNRRSPAEVADAVPPLADLVEPEDQVHLGGPVEQQAVMVMAELEDPSEAAALVFEDVGLLSSESE